MTLEQHVHRTLKITSYISMIFGHDSLFFGIVSKIEQDECNKEQSEILDAPLSS
jgi:hypothetical protein